MNLAEATQVVGAVKGLCPSQQLDNATPLAWEMALHDVTYSDALAALRILARRETEPGKSRYIEPGHIRHAVRRLRDDRLTNHPVVEPPPGLTPKGYLEWRRDLAARIADGETIAPAALEARTVPDYASITKSADV